MQRSTAATQSGGSRDTIGSYQATRFARAGEECDALLRDGIISAGRQCPRMPRPRHYVLNLHEDRNATRSAALVFRAAATVVSDPAAPDTVVEQIMQPLIDRLRLLRPATSLTLHTAIENETLIQGPTDVWQMRARFAIDTGNVADIDTAHSHVVQHIAALQRVAELLLDAKLGARRRRGA